MRQIDDLFVTTDLQFSVKKKAARILAAFFKINDNQFENPCS
jgi:hypothetical protein